MVQVISFDIWRTLLRGRPAFSAARMKYLADLFGWTTPIDELVAVYKQTGRACDKQSETTGVDVGVISRVQAICDHLDLNMPSLSTDKLSKIQRGLGRLRCQPEYIPLLTEPDLLETLRVLKHMGYRLALLSNTGFDSGAAMGHCLRALSIWQLMDARLFSSDIGSAKPSPAIFAELARRTNTVPSRILHIGDSLNADYYGAIKAGMEAIHYTDESTEMRTRPEDYRHLHEISRLPEILRPQMTPVA